MTGLKNLLVALPVFLCVLLAGCGKNVFIPFVPPAAATTGTGNWIFNPVVYQNGEFYFFGGSLINTGGQLTGVLHIDQSCFGSYATDVPYTGTLDSKNNLSITSSPVGGQILTLQGTLSADASTLNNLTFSVTGGCSGNITGGTTKNGGLAFGTGVRVPSPTGAWTTGSPHAGGLSSLSFTEQLTQSPTPDAHGNYALTGTIAVQGSPCFTKGTLQPASHISGYLGHEVYLMNDGSTLEISMETEYGADLFQLNQYALSSVVISGGGCDAQIPVVFLLTPLN